MDSVDTQRERLAVLRRQSATVRQRAPSPQTHLETIALAAWERADALAAALERSILPPEIPQACGILSRVLFEDYITFMYIALSPQSRIDQLKASEIRQYRKMKPHPWLKGKQVEPLPPEAWDFLCLREAAQRAAETKAVEQYGEQGRHRIDVDAYACLPSFWKRLTALGGSEIYAAYTLESRNAVHLGLMVLFNNPTVNPSLFGALAAYRRLLRAVTVALHLEDSIPVDPDEQAVITTSR